MANALTKRRARQREHASFVSQSMSYWHSLDDSIKIGLQDYPHPKLDGQYCDKDLDIPHSLFTYVMWLCQHGYENKARKEVNAYTSTN